METLWESLEELLDVEGNSNYEVEYSVRPCDPHPQSLRGFMNSLERGTYAQAG